MRIDRTPATQADRLYELWDQHTDSPANGVDSSGKLSPSDLQALRLVLYLESLLPSHSQMEKAELSVQIEQLIREDDRMNTSGLARAASPHQKSMRVSSSGRNRFVPTIRTFDRFATLALILAIVSAFVLTAALRQEFGGDGSGRFAAMLGFDEEEPGEQDTSGGFRTSIEVRPGDYEGGTVEVGLWEVTLAPGSAMSAPTSGDPISDPFGFSISQGSVLFGGDDTWRSVEEGGSVGDLAGIDYVRNPNTTPANLLVLAPMPPNAGFPLTIGAWPPDGAASPVAGDAAAPDPVLIASVELDGDEAFQYRVLVSENVLAPGTEMVDAAQFGPPASTLRSITVREGQFAVVPNPSNASPGVTRELVRGDTVQLEADGVWSSDLRVFGSGNARVLALLTMPSAENHTLDQTVESIAPFWGEWTVPASGEINLTVRRLTLEAGATYSLPTDAGVLYHVASGTIIVSNEATGNSGPVDAGGTIAQNPGLILTFINPGPERVELVQVVVSSVSDDDVHARESMNKVGVETLVQETETLAAGNVSLMLEVHEYNGENDGSSAGQGPSVVLITSAAGEISVRRDGGDAEVVTGVGELPVTPPLGEGIRIEPGGYFVAEPGAGWSVTGASGAPSTGVIFTVSPNLEPDGTPIATPAAGTAGTTPLIGNLDACDIAPLTAGIVDDILATPSAAPAPLERSLREGDGGTADPGTTEAITATLQAYTDCNATGDYSRIYASYSHQAIRGNELIRNIVEAGHSVGELDRIAATVEEIALFPDGRAGARTVIGGQAAYLTFVQEDGRWVIDVWDDSAPLANPEATPAT